jgi:hypothetical protein
LSEQDAIARLEADLDAKERELERLNALVSDPRAGSPASGQPQSPTEPDLQTQIRRAETEVVEARTRYEDALNA